MTLGDQANRCCLGNGQISIIHNCIVGEQEAQEEFYPSYHLPRQGQGELDFHACKIVRICLGQWGLSSTKDSKISDLEGLKTQTQFCQQSVKTCCSPSDPYSLQALAQDIHSITQFTRGRNEIIRYYQYAQSSLMENNLTQGLHINVK